MYSTSGLSKGELPQPAESLRTKFTINVRKLLVMFEKLLIDPKFWTRIKGVGVFDERAVERRALEAGGGASPSAPALVMDSHYYSSHVW